LVGLNGGGTSIGGGGGTTSAGGTGGIGDDGKSTVRLSNGGNAGRYMGSFYNSVLGGGGGNVI